MRSNRHQDVDNLNKRMVFLGRLKGVKVQKAKKREERKKEEKKKGTSLDSGLEREESSCGIKVIQDQGGTISEFVSKALAINPWGSSAERSQRALAKSFFDFLLSSEAAA